MNFLRALFSGWTWQMAWRDSRSSRRKLLLFSSSIVIGIAALVAISSFGVNMQSAIDAQAKGLLGADLAVADNPVAREMEPRQLECFDTHGLIHRLDWVATQR